MRRSLAVLAAFASVFALVNPIAGATAPERHGHRPTPPPWLQVKDGVTQPQFSLANAITQTVFVETPVDTDRDGKRDRVRLMLSRPGETQTLGIKVPVIFE